MDPMLKALTEVLIDFDIPSGPDMGIPSAPWVDYIPLQPDSCDECDGMGYTARTAPEIHKDKDGRPYTHKLGSGCPQCLGVGRK